MRRRQRGFDAAEAIAGALASRTGLPYEPCLGRTQTTRQVGRPRAQRMADPPRVRVVSPVPDMVVLVDDVMTTGATLGACAEALRAGGALGVVALTFARSRPAWGRLGEARSAA
jgi:predicted amidophosphoribosyltransferase